MAGDSETGFVIKEDVADLVVGVVVTLIFSIHLFHDSL